MHAPARHTTPHVIRAQVPQLTNLFVVGIESLECQKEHSAGEPPDNPSHPANEVYEPAEDPQVIYERCLSSHRVVLMPHDDLAPAPVSSKGQASQDCHQ